METTVSLKILVFFLSKFNWKVLFFLMLMTSIKSFCLLQNKKTKKQTHTHTQTNHNVNTCHYLKMIILNFFYYQIFFKRKH